MRNQEPQAQKKTSKSKLRQELFLLIPRSIRSSKKNLAIFLLKKTCIRVEEVDFFSMDCFWLCIIIHYTPIGGSLYIETPTFIALKKEVINPQNLDQQSTSSGDFSQKILKDKTNFEVETIITYTKKNTISLVSIFPPFFMT